LINECLSFLETIYNYIETTKIKQDNDLSVGEHKQIAKDMGHSQSTNMVYAFITPPIKKRAPPKV
jgi:hypothetical protein